MAAQINSFRLLMRNTLQKRKKCRTGMASRTAASALSDLKNAAPAVPATRTRASTIEILNPGKNCSFEDVCMSDPLKNPAVVYFIMYRFENNRSGIWHKAAISVCPEIKEPSRRFRGELPMLRTGLLQNTVLTIMTVAVLFVCPPAEAEEQLYQYGRFAAGAKVYLFADKVNLRAAPSTSGRVVGNLPVGTELQTLADPDGEHFMAGFSAPWYRVQSVAQPAVQGYVWGGLLSPASINFDDSGKRLTLVSGITGFGEFNFAGECRVISEGQVIAKAPFKWIATLMGEEKNYGYNVRIDELPWKGTQDIRKVFQISCGYDACGYTRGNILFFWTGREIVTGPTAEEVSEAGVFHVESVFVFPGDEGLGEKSLLLRTTSGEEADIENGVAASAKKVETLYTWNGKAWEAGKPVETALPAVPSGQENDEAVKSDKDGNEDGENADEADDTKN